MLARLYIKDFALIEEAEIEFGPGLNIITGETGTGKSILLGALNSILGGPASADLVRDGAGKCTVEGLFEFAPDDPAGPRLAALDAPLDDGQLILRREMHAGGRSRAYGNGLGLALKKLRQVGAVLVDLHGQHEHQSLLEVPRHAAFLDAFGGLAAEADRVAERYGSLRQLEQALDQMRQERRELQREEELRHFQLDEIRGLAPGDGEDEELEGELRILENLESLTAGAGELFEALYQAEGSVLEQLGRARRQLDRLAETDPALAAQAESLEGLIYGVEDLGSGLRDYTEKLDADPERVEQIRGRLDALRRVSKKYGGSLEQVLALARELEQQEDRSGALDGEISRRAAELESHVRGFGQLCRELSAGRQRAAESLAGAVATSLGSLGMAQACFEARLRADEDAQGLVELEGRRWRADERGLEEVEFYLSPNPGEGLRPLARIASGGEISRIMLVLKELIAEKDTVSTLVFDEIDTGISGRIAAAVGRRLRTLSASHQAIVITHLPQIASMADQHFSVRKRPQGGRTITEVVALDETGRTEEIAHLLAGETVTDTARQHAEDMLR